MSFLFVVFSPVELNQNEETNEVQKTNMRNRKRIHSDSVEDEVSHESLCNNGMKCVQPQAENGHFPEQQKTKEVKDQRSADLRDNFSHFFKTFVAMNF